MKKLLTILLLAVGLCSSKAQITNFFWSGPFISNYIYTNIQQKLDQIQLNVLTTNAQTSITNILDTIQHSSGFISKITPAVLPSSVGVYGVITNFEASILKDFTADLALGSLTNLLEGMTTVGWQLSFDGGNNDNYEITIFTNMVECPLIEANVTFASTAHKTSSGGGGNMFLPANCRVDLRVKNLSDNDDPTIDKAQIWVIHH